MLNTIYLASMESHEEVLCIGIAFLERDIYNIVIYCLWGRTLPSNTKPNQTLDCTGLYCPEPVFRTRLELDKLAVGEVLEVLADDPASEEDIKSLVKRLGQDLLSVEKEGNVFRFVIRKVE